MGDAHESAGKTPPPWRLAAVGAVLILFGLWLAAFIQAADGVRVSDVRWRAADGTPMSALLYKPAPATAEKPAPGVLAVHGYINTRETQSAFAIELARRGYVVLAMDQRGHGYSGGAAISKGFGGPEGLAYLRGLPFVDKANIGLEGHSMGGWTVLAAAAAMPDGYKSMVLEGSSVGAPFARDGDPAWPRNLAVVFSRYDEFAPLMWGVPSGGDVGKSPKLQKTFGVAAPVEPGKLHGDIAAGTGRLLRIPTTTHPGDHISTEAVADALDWFDRTLDGGTPRPLSDQIWIWKEIGTGVALVGVFVLLLGLFDLLLTLPVFAALRGAPPAGAGSRDGRWWALFGASAFVPALLYLGLTMTADPPLAPSAIFPQAITNWLTIWALANALVALIVGVLLKMGNASSPTRWLPALGLALATTTIAYLVVWGAAFLPLDFRFWVVALRPFSPWHPLAFLAYLPAFGLFLWLAFRGATTLAARAATPGGQYLTAIAAMSLGFVLVVAVQYAWLFVTGSLPLPGEALEVIVAIQFVPLLIGLAVLAVFTWRRTGSHVPGALLAALFVTWYMVAGTATHFAG